VHQEQRRLERMRGASEWAALRGELIEAQPRAPGNPQNSHDEVHGRSLPTRHAAPMLHG
jgi:hypothetical protein